MADEKLHEIDLYELLGINIESTIQEVKKAYRKKALTCHPDKNPDNPRAAELFHQLSRALEILTDNSARSAYNKVLNGRKAAKLRHQKLDSRRKKFKEELEERERRAQESFSKSGSFVSKTDEEKLQAEIERLRKEGSKQVKEEVAYVQRQVQLEKETGLSSEYNNEDTQHRLKVRWTVDKDDAENGGYSYDVLHRILSKYGSIVALVLSPKRKGSALLEFGCKEAAAMAHQLEKGLSENPLTIDWLESSRSGKASSSGPRLSDIKQKDGGIFPSMDGSQRCAQPKDLPSFSFSPIIPVEIPQPLDREFESVVLRRMRQAEERKRIIEDLEKDE